MKLLQLLLSLCLALLLCAAPQIQAQGVPTISTAIPTPPNGEAGSNTNGPATPPTLPTTVKGPEVNTTYGDYAG